LGPLLPPNPVPVHGRGDGLGERDEGGRSGTCHHLSPADTPGVQDRVGSLDAGKDADSAVWIGHPFRVGSKVEEVYIGGTKVFEA